MGNVVRENERNSFMTRFVISDIVGLNLLCWCESGILRNLNMESFNLRIEAKTKKYFK